MPPSPLFHTFRTFWPHRIYTSVRAEDDEPKPVEKMDRQVQQRSNGSVGALSVVLTGLVILNLGILWGVVRMYEETRVQLDNARHVEPTLLDTPIPQFQKEVKTFTQDFRFVVRPSADSDAAWESLGGPENNHTGFIWIDNYAEYGLASPNDDNGRALFGVSVLHQLHCLGGIRKMFWDVVEGRISPTELLEEYPEDTNQPSFGAMTQGLWHVAHCFDYVRQALMCAGDMSPEWPVEVNGNGLVIGWDNPHECRNWGAIWNYIEDHS